MNNEWALKSLSFYRLIFKSYIPEKIWAESWWETSINR